MNLDDYLLVLWNICIDILKFEVFIVWLGLFNVLVGINGKFR